MSQENVEIVRRFFDASARVGEAYFKKPGDDQVIAVVNGALKGKGSGIDVTARLYTVVTLRGRLIWRAHDYLDLREALEAAGLSE